MRRFMVPCLALLLLAGGLTRAFAVTSGLTLITSNPAGTAAAGGAAISQQYADPRVISANGRFCVFVGTTGLVNLPTTAIQDVFYRDLQTGVTTLVSVNAAGTAGGNDYSVTPTISADGRYVAYFSNATDLVTTPIIRSTPNVYVRDMSTGLTKLSGWRE